MYTFKVKKSNKSKRHSNEEDTKLFASSTIDNVEVKTSSALDNDLECAGQSLQESKHEQSTDDHLFGSYDEKSRKRKKSTPKKLNAGTPTNSNENIKHCSKVPLKESHLCDICDCSFNNFTELATHKQIHSSALEHDLECAGQYLLESKHEQSTDAHLLGGYNENPRKRKKSTPKKLSTGTPTPTNSNESIKHCSKVPLKESHLCDICDCSFNNFTELATHKQIHSSALDNDLECAGQYLQESKHEQSTDDHLLGGYNENPRKRKKSTPKKLIISTPTNSNENIKNHSKVRSKESHLCDICDCYFDNSTELATHKLIHPITPSIDLADSTARDLQYDMILPQISVHFRCHICDYKSKQRGTLNRHLRVHSEERCFKCEFCEYSTRHKSTLETHTKTHLDIREYECELCFKKFLTNQNLRAHTMIHTGERPYECELCNKAFVQKQHLTTHTIRVHLNTL